MEFSLGGELSLNGVRALGFRGGFDMTPCAPGGLLDFRLVVTNIRRFSVLVHERVNHVEDEQPVYLPLEMTKS